MGTKMAPAYANLFMGKLEEHLINLAPNHIHIWKRFIDDIFIIWTGTTAEFEEYMHTINQTHPTIKFTHEISDMELTFLDVTLYKGDRFLHTNILDLRTHIKDTNKQLYVHATSYHPPSIIKAISKGETQRYLRTNSNETNFNKMTCKLIHKLKQRGYKQNQIANHIKEIKFSGRKKVLTRKQKPQQTDKLIFVTQYTDNIQRIKRIFNKHWKLIKDNQYLKHIFPSPPMIAYRANPSLRKKLVRAKLKPINTEPTTTPVPILSTSPQPQIDPNYPFNLFQDTSQNFRNPIKRHHKECQLCKQLNTKSFVISTTRPTRTPIDPPPPHQYYNCHSRNVVYLITCQYKNCGAQYVGYTMRKLHERLYEHKTTYESQLRSHCCVHNHLPFKLDIQILTQAPTNEPNPELWLKQKEYY